MSLLDQPADEAAQALARALPQPERIEALRAPHKYAAATPQPTAHPLTAPTFTRPDARSRPYEPTHAHTRPPAACGCAHRT
eukprot:2926535-Prymnesium_polylepis.1